MKITRSALKNLIKEEMNRINEEDEKTAEEATGDRVAGTDVEGTYAFDGMETRDLDSLATSAFRRRGAQGPRFRVEGLGAVRTVVKASGDVERNDQRVDDRGTGFRMSLGGSEHHAKASIPDRLPGKSFPDYNDTMDRTGYVQLSVRPDRLDGGKVPVWSDTVKDAVVKFNEQNAGLGGILTDGSNGKFNFRGGDGAPAPQVGMSFTISVRGRHG